MTNKKAKAKKVDKKAQASKAVQTAVTVLAGEGIKSAGTKPNLKPGTVTSKDGFPIVGWLVNWSAKEFSIKRDDLVDALRKVGIDPDIAVEVLPKNAANRAIKEKAKGKDTFHRKVADGQDTAAFVIAATEVDETNFDASFTTETKLKYDKTAKSIVVEGSGQQEIKDAFERNKLTYASDQFRSIILRYVKRHCAAITYLETGNIYFIPAQKQQDLDKVIALFNLLGTQVRFVAKEEVDTKQVRQVLWQVTVGEIKGDLESMTDDLNKLGDEITERSFDTRLKKYEDLKTRVEMFEMGLEVSASDLKAKLDELTKTLKAKTLGV